MTPDLIYLVAGAVTLSVIGTGYVAVLWLCKLRETVLTSLSEVAGRQIRTAQHLSDSISQIQKQQDNYNHQIQILAQAGMRLQQELNSVTNRLDHSKTEQTRGTQTLH